MEDTDRTAPASKIRSMVQPHPPGLNGHCVKDDERYKVPIVGVAVFEDGTAQLLSLALSGEIRPWNEHVAEVDEAHVHAPGYGCPWGDDDPYVIGPV
jgi:hypothetical protein